MAQPVGSVAALWRYPVKSMLGEPMDALRIEPRGVVADREFAIRNADGKFGSGKNTRRFRRIDRLFEFRALLTPAGLAVRLPDGREMSGANPAIHAALSEALGQPVTLAREAAISHFDQARIHVVTSASLEWLRTRLPDGQIDARRFRPNIVIEVSDAAALIEESWIGCTLCLGDGVRLQTSHRTERCVMVTNKQDELTSRPEILRELAQVNDACFGVYAQVLTAGDVGIGDAVTLIPP